MRFALVLGAALTLCALIAFATELDQLESIDVHRTAIDSDEQKQHPQQELGLGEELDGLIGRGRTPKVLSQGKETASSQVLKDGGEPTELDDEVERTAIGSEQKQHPQQEVGHRMLSSEPVPPLEGSSTAELQVTILFVHTGPIPTPGI